jgi:hypothetical protein
MVRGRIAEAMQYRRPDGAGDGVRSVFCVAFEMHHVDGPAGAVAETGKARRVGMLIKSQ